MDLKDWLARCPLIAILRGVTPNEVVAIGAALHEAGVLSDEEFGRAKAKLLE